MVDVTYLLFYFGDAHVKTLTPRSALSVLILATALLTLADSHPARAVTTVFFNSSQSTNLVSTNATTDTISTEGYVFTYTRDKFFTVGTTNLPGRYVRIFWPDGLEAQYVTAGPTPGKAKTTIRRVDGAVFDLTAFSAKLLASPGAGRAIEIVPFLNGQEPLNDPLAFDVSSGFYGSVHYFDTTTPTHIGSTVALTNYDAYVLNLTLDYALMSLTVVDASIPPPVLGLVPLDATTIQLSWPAEASAYGLESATNLPAQAWITVTNSVTDNGSFFSVDLPVTGNQQFYRLKK